MRDISSAKAHATTKFMQENTTNMQHAAMNTLAAPTFSGSTRVIKKNEVPPGVGAYSPSSRLAILVQNHAVTNQVGTLYANLAQCSPWTFLFLPSLLLTVKSTSHVPPQSMFRMTIISAVNA